MRRVAARAGVTAHVHAIRAAFAVRFLESHPGDLEALQPLMGHSRLETTAVYLRRLNRVQAMERVRDLTWRSVFPPNAAEAHTGHQHACKSALFGPEVATKRSLSVTVRARLTQLFAASEVRDARAGRRAAA